MENTTDLSQIHDSTTLKSMAYDQVGLIEQAQNNLRLIQQRLAQVQKEELHALETTETAENTDPTE